VIPAARACRRFAAAQQHAAVGVPHRVEQGAVGDVQHEMDVAVDEFGSEHPGGKSELL
jgi:hypothetical protein